jgi:AraC-like DNA-binding protein
MGLATATGRKSFLQSSSRQFTLSGNPTFQTTDPDKAGRHLSPYLCHHTVSTRHDKQLSFKHWHSEVGSVGLHLLRYGVDLTISGTPEDDCYIVLLLLTGWGELKQNGVHSIVCPENVCVINPDQNMSLYLTSDQSNLTLRVPRRLIEDFIGRETGTLLTAPVHFGPSPGQNGSSLRNFMSFIIGELGRNSPSLTPRLVSHQIEQTLAGLMLSELPHDQQILLLENSAPASPVYIRVAEEFMEAHVRESITLQDIALAAGISIRTLQKGFRQHRNTSPMTALRNRRLLLAREELLRANPYSRNVTSVATNCGFTHLSRFASLFKARFGECPSDTLKRQTIF